MNPKEGAREGKGKPSPKVATGEGGVGAGERVRRRLRFTRKLREFFSRSKERKKNREGGARTRRATRQVIVDWVRAFTSRRHQQGPRDEGGVEDTPLGSPEPARECILNDESTPDAESSLQAGPPLREETTVDLSVSPQAGLAPLLEESTVSVFAPIPPPPPENEISAAIGESLTIPSGSAQPLVEPRSDERDQSDMEHSPQMNSTLFPLKGSTAWDPAFESLPNIVGPISKGSEGTAVPPEPARSPQPEGSAVGGSASEWPLPPRRHRREGAVSDESRNTTPQTMLLAPLESAEDRPHHQDTESSPADIVVHDFALEPPFPQLENGANRVPQDSIAHPTTPPKPASPQPTSSYSNHPEAKFLPEVGVNLSPQEGSTNLSLTSGSSPSLLGHDSDSNSSEYSETGIPQQDPVQQTPPESMESQLEALFAGFFDSRFAGSRLGGPIARASAPGPTAVSPGYIIGEVDIDSSEYNNTPQSPPSPSMEPIDGCPGQPDGEEDSSQTDVTLVRCTVFDSEVDGYRLETEFHHEYVVHTKNKQEPYTWRWERPTWKQQKVIGEGISGAVWLQKKRGGEELRVVKTLVWETLKKPGPPQELRALVNTKSYDHLFVAFLGWYEDKHCMFLAMEYIKRGDLDKYISANPGEAQANAREITRQIAEGLEVLHERQICHRDLKPQNILVASYDPIWVKITDFGCSKEKINTVLKTQVGSPGYHAPELLGAFTRAANEPETFTFALDIWSLGCMVHKLLTLQPPFITLFENEPNPESTLSTVSTEPQYFEINIDTLFEYCRGTREFPTEVLQRLRVDDEGIAFVQSLLIASPEKRPPITRVLKDPWLQGYTSGWFVDLKNQFSRLGVDLDPGKGGVLVRQASEADIMRFLPTLPKENIPYLLLKAITEECEKATAKLLKSKWVDGLIKGKVFQLAAEGGDPSLMKRLVEYGLDVDASIDGQAVLQWVVETQHIDAVRSLLENHPDIENSTDGQKAFHVALKSKRLDMVKIFLNNRFNAFTNEQGTTPLEVAAEDGCIEFAELLLGDGAKTDDITSLNAKKAALQIVARSGHFEIIKLLLSDNSTSTDDAADKRYQTALQESAEGGHTNIVEYLLNAGTGLNTERLASALQGAAKSGHINLVKLLLEKDADVNARDGAALKSAAANGHLDIVKLLLEKGADMNARDGAALRSAAANGHLDIVKLLLNPEANLNASLRAAAEGGHLDIFKLLLDHGADIDAPETAALEQAAVHGHTHIIKLLLDVKASVGQKELGVALRQAAAGRHLDTAELLLKNRAKVDAGKQNTPLKAAIKGGHKTIAELLLRYHANVNPTAKGKGGRTPLQVAAGSGYLDIVEVLLKKGAEVNAAAVDVGGRTALQAAAEGGHIDIVKFLLGSGANVHAAAAKEDGQTSLQAAVVSGHIDVVKLLLENNADMNGNAARSHGRTALQIAAGSGHIDIAHLLLDNDADVNAVGYETALEAAARGGYISIVDLLLEYGANANPVVQDPDSRTPLQAAIVESHADITELLLLNGADVNAVAPKASIRTALQAAIQYGGIELVRLLLSRGANVDNDVGNVGGRTALQVAAGSGDFSIFKLLWDKTNLAYDVAAEESGRTALQAAAEGGCIEIVTLLLGNKADVNAAATKGNGRTALQAAAEKGHTDILNLLLQNGADVNATGPGGLTALQAAAGAGHTDTAKLLLVNGADVNAAPGGSDGFTVLQAAARAGDIDTVKLLLANGADVNAPGSGGSTALQAAAMAERIRTDIVELLLASGANPNDELALEEAFGGGNLDIARILLEKGATSSKKYLSMENLDKMEEIQPIIDEGSGSDSETEMSRLMSAMPQMFELFNSLMLDGLRF